MNDSETTSHNADDALNRRVVLFFFQNGTTVDSGVWPCPTVRQPGDARQDQFGRWRTFFNQWYTVAQGGQCLTEKFPDDGPCMGTNEGSHALDSSDWAWGDRKVQYWIDIGVLGDGKDPGLVSDTFKDGDVCDNDPIITPDRKIAW